MIIGHERIIAYLDAVLKRGIMPHAFLFYGPAEVGKRHVAREFIKALFCASHQSRSIIQNCGACYDCLSLEKFSHPKILNISPTNAGNIGIDDILELRRRLTLSVPKGDWLAVLIDRADSLTPEAANALLKILEEPPSRIIFILITEDPALVLPTIVSRAITLRFSPASDKLLTDYLRSLPIFDEKKSELLRVSTNLPGRLVRALEDEKFLREALQSEKNISELMSGNLVGRFRYAESLVRDRGDIKKFFQSFYLFFHHRLIGGEGDRSKVVSLFNMAEEVWAALETTNVNPRLALERLFLEF